MSKREIMRVIKVEVILQPRVPKAKQKEKGDASQSCMVLEVRRETHSVTIRPKHILRSYQSSLRYRRQASTARQI
jgi:hypothetical protein